MSEVPFALALAAGMLAAVNPCGFAMLPAYLSLLVVGDDSPTRKQAIGRALTATAAMTAGFTAVFGVFGLAVAPVAGQVQEHLPWFTVILGLVLAAAGGWLLAGRELPALVPRVRGRAVTRSVSSMVLYGGAYAIASLGCTIGPFLAIVVSAFRTDSTATGIALFAAYAVGMGLIVGVAALAVALARVGAVGRLRRFGGLASRLGGGLLLVAGAYVGYYGWYEIRVLRGGSTADPVIDTAGRLQSSIANSLSEAGVPAVAAAFSFLLIISIFVIRTRRSRMNAGSRRSEHR